MRRRFIQLRRFANRPWFVPLSAFLAGVDIFFLVAPTDALLVTACMAKPRRWFWIAATITTGSALGALAMGFGMHYYGESLLAFLGLDPAATGWWADTVQFVDRYGALAVVIGAGGPFPLQPFAIIAGLAKMPLLLLFAAAWVGRLAKYLFFAWLAANAPKHLNRIWGVKKDLKRITSDR